MEPKSPEEFDLELFEMFKSTFALKYPDMFTNKKLFNSWGRKCNFIINSLKNVFLKKEKDILVQKLINTLIEFLADKEITSGLKYLSSFNNELFSAHNQEMLNFRNSISGCIFTLMIYDKKTQKYRPPINEEIEGIVISYFKEYGFLKSLFDIIEYSLNTDDIYNDYLFLLNNNDILKELINNKKCILNTSQRQFITSNKFDFDNSQEFLDKLKALSMSNEDLAKELKNISSKKSRKHKKKNVHNNKNTSTNTIIIDSPKDTLDNKREDKKEDIKTEIKYKENKEDINIGNNNKESQENFKIKSINKENEEEKKLNDLNPLYNNINAISNESLTERIISLEKKIQDLEAIIFEERRRNKENTDNLNATIEEERRRNKETTDDLKALKASIVKERKKNKKDMNNLENKIDICELKISMICYRDLIKEIINYSFDFFGLEIKGENTLWNKVKTLNNVLKSSKDIKILTPNEKTIFSQFIYISFRTLKQVNNNVHDNEEGYIPDYSISNFVKCFKDYLELYLYDILNDKSNNKITEFINLIPQIKDIEAIIDKIGFNYVEDFDCDEF